MKNFIDLYGPIKTFVIIGIIFFIIIFIFSLPLKFPKSEEQNNVVTASSKNIGPKEMLKTKEFYGLWICYMIGTFSGLMAIGITSPFAQEVVGLDSKKSTFFVSILAIFNGVGRPIFGFLVDKIKPFKTILLSFIIIIIASILGLFSKSFAVGHFFIVFSLFWLILGGWLSIAPATTYFIFGTKNYSKNYGIMFTAYGIAAVLGTTFSSKLKDILGSYVFSFYPTLILAVIGIIICLITLNKYIKSV
jgi:MFS family permease